MTYPGPDCVISISYLGGLCHGLSIDRGHVNGRDDSSFRGRHDACSNRHDHDGRGLDRASGHDGENRNGGGARNFARDCRNENRNVLHRAHFLRLIALV